MTTELRPEDLRRRCDPSALPFDSTADHSGPLEIVGQERAVQAVRFGIEMQRDGYNVFALGPRGVGKEMILRHLLAHEAPRRPTPPDWCYVLDFDEPRRARAMKLPPATAIGLRDHMRRVATTPTREVIDRVRAAYRELPVVLDYLDAVGRDIVANTERERLQRYDINVMVDHSAGCGAPVICEENPTCANLIGRIEHVAELGALVTNFTLIRPGALHRANGGYLLIDALELLRQPFAWGALKRALRTRELRIEAQARSLAPVVSLEPEPIPLDVKVILFGDELVYYLLVTNDPEFEDLFKVMADFEPSMDRAPSADAEYATLIAGLVCRDGLRPFDRGAIACLVEHAARLAGDARRLSLQLRSIGDLAQESDDCARRAGRTTATRADVQAAIDHQRRRVDRLRDRTLDAIRRDTISIDTHGAAVGQINGLSVLELGRTVFGYPARITARARVGGGEVIDIEREVDLGGPLHSKGVLILAGLLGARYARRMPLAFSATIVLEQSYGSIEGDSASLAELCALLSDISELPILQGLAVTGSVSQHGEVQAVGAVNEKIEGFFDVCRERGLTGEHGVVIPRANVQHLMLREDVIEAVAGGRFHVHAVRDVDEAIALLTGRAAGTRGLDGRFTDDSVNALVEARLAAFTADVRRAATAPMERWHRHAG